MIKSLISKAFAILLSSCILVSTNVAVLAKQPLPSGKEKPAEAKSETIIGRYYLAGVMETGSGLRLNADYSFDWYLSVGSLDIVSGGSWTMQDDTVILLFDPPKKGTNSPEMGRRVLQIDGRNLVPDAEMGGVYLRAQTKKEEAR